MVEPRDGTGKGDVSFVNRGDVVEQASEMLTTSVGQRQSADVPRLPRRGRRSRRGHTSKPNVTTDPSRPQPSPGVRARGLKDRITSPSGVGLLRGPITPSLR